MAHHDISLHCAIWSLSGHSGLWPAERPVDLWVHGLVRWTTSPISGAECDSLIDFSAQLCAPYCVELSDPKRISLSTVAALNWQIAEGLHLRQWLLAVATIKL